MQVLHYFILFYFLKNISQHNVKNEKWKYCIIIDQSYCGGAWMKMNLNFTIPSQ
jgi:hypothetical protein